MIGMFSGTSAVSSLVPRPFFATQGKIGLVNGLFCFHSLWLQNCDVTFVGM